VPTPEECWPFAPEALVQLAALATQLYAREMPARASGGSFRQMAESDVRGLSTPFASGDRVWLQGCA